MRVDLHYAEIDHIKRDAATTEYLLALGERIKLLVLLNSPVGERQRGPHFIDSLYVKVIGGAEPHVRVGSTSFKAWWIEFGAVRPNSVFHARAPFRRALSLLNIESTRAGSSRVRPG